MHMACMGSTKRYLDSGEPPTGIRVVGSSCSRAIGCYDGVLTATQAEAFIRQNQVEFDHTSV